MTPWSTRKGAEAPNHHFPPVRVHVLSSTTGSLLPAGTESTAMRIIFHLPPLSWTIFETKETGEYSSATNCRINFNQLVPPCWRKVVRSKSMKTLVFDPGGCSDRLRDYPFLRGRSSFLSWRLFRSSPRLPVPERAARVASCGAYFG